MMRDIKQAALVLGVLAAVAGAQYALDNNLRVGSNKVNEANRPGFQRELYRPAVVQTSGPLDVRSNTGQMVYSAENAFNPSRPYLANSARRPYGPQNPYVQTGYSSDRRSQGYEKRFRGY